MPTIDLRADLNADDDEGCWWSLPRDAADPAVVVAGAPDTSVVQRRSDDDDAFAAYGACFHVVVRLDDVVEPVDGSDRDGGGPVGDGVQELLEHRRWKVAGLAGVRGEPHAVGQPVHRVERVDRPVV